MSHGSLTDAVNASGHVRCTASWIDSTPAMRCCIAHGHVACELVITCSPRARGRTTRCGGCRGGPGCAPVRIDVWLASVTVGSDAIAPCSNAVPISMSRATFGASPAAAIVVEHVGVRAVEQEADDVIGVGPRSIEQVEQRPRRPGAARRASSGRACAVQPDALGMRCGAESAGTVGATSTSRQRARHQTERPDARAADDERRPGLHDADRPVLAAVTALVLPVVGRGVDGREVGRRRTSRRAGRPARRRTGSSSACGPARGRRARSASGENRSVAWSPSGLRPSTTVSVNSQPCPVSAS